MQVIIVRHIAFSFACTLSKATTLRAMGIPLNMFTVTFAIGRLPGWISQWKESVVDPRWKFHRPRQIYIGVQERDFVPIHERG